MENIYKNKEYSCFVMLVCKYVDRNQNICGKLQIIRKNRGLEVLASGCIGDVDFDGGVAARLDDSVTPIH